MSRLQVMVPGDLIDSLVERGEGFLRVGIDLNKVPLLYSELILEDLEGERSPVDCVVTGIKANENKRFGDQVQFIVRISCTNEDADELMDQELLTLDEAMSTDFAAVDTPGTPILPGSLTPSGPEVGLLKDRDADRMERGALWVYDRRFRSKAGMSVP